MDATARRRNANAVDYSWAPWWRAQARAVALVATQHGSGIDIDIDALLAEADAFADLLEERRSGETALADFLRLRAAPTSRERCQPV